MWLGTMLGILGVVKYCMHFLHWNLNLSSFVLLCIFKFDLMEKLAS